MSKERDGVVFRVFFGMLFGLRLGVILAGACYYHSGAWKRRKRLIDD
ncbi:MAG: hypothetical protein ACI4PC_08605 [Oscillospiraceae bacterium]